MPPNEGAEQLSLDDLWVTVRSRKPGEDELVCVRELPDPPPSLMADGPSNAVRAELLDSPPQPAALPM